jgi:hypothetical protein
LLSGYVRRGPAVYGWSRRIRGEVSPAILTLFVIAEGVFDELPVDLLPAVDALGVDPQEHLNTVPGPLGDLGRVNARVQPGGQARVPQVIRPPASGDAAMAGVNASSRAPCQARW